LKELAGIVKALLPGIGAIPPEKLKVLEEFIAKKGCTIIPLYYRFKIVANSYAGNEIRHPL
jgi:hypothetical protein